MSCNKFPFDSKQEASAMMSKRPNRGKAYLCAECSKWHVSTDRRVKANKRRIKATSRDLKYKEWELAKYRYKK